MVAGTTHVHALFTLYGPFICIAERVNGVPNAIEPSIVPLAGISRTKRACHIDQIFDYACNDSTQHDAKEDHSSNNLYRSFRLVSQSTRRYTSTTRVQIATRHRMTASESSGTHHAFYRLEPALSFRRCSSLHQLVCAFHSCLQAIYDRGHPCVGISTHSSICFRRTRRF